MVLKKRDAQNSFQQIWSTVVDPASRFVNPADQKPAGRVWSFLENGPPSKKVDLLVIGEGYTEAEMPKLKKDVGRLVGRLFATEPFLSRKSDFNVRVLELPASKSGVHRPRTRDDHRSVTGVEYNIFDSERYVLTLDNGAMRDAAASAPYDFLEILVNEKQYGGGGIFNDQATASVDTGYAEYVFVHEFGHHFAGWGRVLHVGRGVRDGRQRASGAGEPNLTANGARPKWMGWSRMERRLPTPWQKERCRRAPREYQASAELREENVPESQMDECFAASRSGRRSSWPPKAAKHVGAFEGRGRGQRPLSPRGGLHHVHARRGDSATCARGRFCG